MLLESDIFNPSGTLPDVSRVGIPTATGSASALAGVMSGKQYSDAIDAATKPALNSRLNALEDKLDQRIATVQERAQSQRQMERKALGAALRQSVAGNGSRPSPEYTEPPMPGEDVASNKDSGNLLDKPPPPGMEAPPDSPVLPPPLSPIAPDILDLNEVFKVF